MLAERRRKAKYVLNPIRKPLWATDSSGIKYGKDLMEKMGWSAGKGLGANEQGIQEPLRVFTKNDTKGIGYKKNEENWIEYQDEFNLLLNQLASNTDNAKTKEAEKSEVMSLEEKSKLSKARMHYQKFTRGKDISKYSENDLSCILGINKIKKTKSETSVEKETSIENNLYETNFGVTTINSGSIKDYFKKKWNMNNLKFENSSVKQYLNAEQRISENPIAVLEKKSKKRQKESRNEFLDIENRDEGNENIEIKKHKKRKKLNLDEEIPRKKEKNICDIDKEVQEGEENPAEIENSYENFSCDSNKGIPKSKEKKKKKRECEELKEVELKYQSEVSINEKINNKRKKKKSKKKYKEQVNGDVMEEPQNEILKDLKKARKKEKQAEISLKTDNNSEVEVSENTAAEKLKNVTEVAPERNTRRKKKLKMDAEFEDKDKNNFKGEWEGQKSQLEDDTEEQFVKKMKEKKRKEVFLENKEIKDDDKGAHCMGEAGETMIHTHKTVLFHMKKPFIGGLKNCTTAKVLNLICGAEIERFKGANLGNIQGYGYKKKIEKNVGR